MSFFTDQPAKAKFLEKSNEEGEGEEVDYSSNTFMGFSDDWQHSYPTSQSNEVDALLDTIENRLFAEHEVDNEEEQLFPSNPHFEQKTLDPKDNVIESRSVTMDQSNKQNKFLAPVTNNIQQFRNDKNNNNSQSKFLQAIGNSSSNKRTTSTFAIEKGLKVSNIDTKSSNLPGGSKLFATTKSSRGTESSSSSSSSSANSTPVVATSSSNNSESSFEMTTSSAQNSNAKDDHSTTLTSNEFPVTANANTDDVLPMSHHSRPPYHVSSKQQEPPNKMNSQTTQLCTEVDEKVNKMIADITSMKNKMKTMFYTRWQDSAQVCESLCSLLVNDCKEELSPSIAVLRKRVDSLHAQVILTRQNDEDEAK